MKYVALLVLTALILGLPTINFQHHLNLPDIDKSRIISHHEVGFSNLFVTVKKVTDIRLPSILQGEDRVKDIMVILAEARPGDVVNFHLAGYGGDGDAMFEIINGIHASKATVNMIVESNVYSAHAYLATQGNTLTMLPYTYMMFHTVSAYGVDCSQEQGLDRTVPNSEHCQAMLDAVMAEANLLIANIPLLTLEEQQRIATGHDVYITAADYASRKIK